MQRRRLRFVALALGTIGLGLVVHLRGGVLGPVARDVVGDALWAAMIMWWVGAAAPSARLSVRAPVAFMICAGVELSQLIHAPALDAFRATTLGHLMFGSDFDPRDFVGYAAGVIAAMVVELQMVRRQVFVGLSVAMIALSGCFRFAADDVRTVSHILNIAALPASVHSLKCEDEFSIDPGISCYFEIDPAEFPKLISGRSFVAQSDTGDSHVRYLHPGPNFTLGPGYAAHWETPPGTKQNHYTHLYVDVNRRQVLLEYGAY